MSLVTTFLLAAARRLKRGGVIINEHTLSAAQTRFHVEVLQRWFDFISLAELPARLGRPGERPFCLLTFDDGKRSNFTAAAPELERLGVPAVFYLTTDAVTHGSTFWFDRRNQLVRALGYCPPGLKLDRLKRLPLEQVMERLDAACAAYGFQDGEPSDDLRPMSWDEARRLNRDLFTIGAHGKTHAILPRETRARAYAEIEESLAVVSREMGQPCSTFAFANGNYTPELLAHARRCGASTTMTTEPMWAGSRSSLWCLPRILLHGGLSQARIEAKIALAGLRGALANPDGSGRRYALPRKAAPPTRKQKLVPQLQI